jgi:type I restriction enzyme S subunit
MLDRAKNQGEPTSYLRNVNVRWFRFDLDGLLDIHVMPSEARQFAVQDGDLFICEGGEPGRCAVWKGGDRPLVYQKALHRFRSLGGMLPEFLMYALRSRAETGELAQYFTGTTIKHLTGESLARLKVRVPPLPEQRRIVGGLDTLLARADACRQRLDRVTAILKRFRQSVLAAATSGELTRAWRVSARQEPTGSELLDAMRANHLAYRQLAQARGHSRKNTADSSHRRGSIESAPDTTGLPDLPRTWAWATGADVVEPGADIVYGIVQPGPKLAVGIPYVRGMDIVEDRILVDQLMKTSPEIATRYERSSLKAGDVILGIIRATKVAVVPEELTGGNITQGTARFRPSSGITSRFLALVLRAPQTQVWLHTHYRGIDMPGLNLADVRRVPVPLPPKEEQEEISRRVAELLAIIQNVEAKHNAAAAAIGQLTPSALGAAFRGELVPQDPNDEPASVLLERLRAHRAAIPGADRQRRTRGPVSRSKTPAGPKRATSKRRRVL